MQTTTQIGTQSIKWIKCDTFWCLELKNRHLVDVRIHFPLGDGMLDGDMSGVEMTQELITLLLELQRCLHED